jgi:hypothetical protein
VPEGFLAALTTVGAVKRFERVLDCAEGAVGLAQAASAAKAKRRASGFITDSCANE